MISNLPSGVIFLQVIYSQWEFENTAKCSTQYYEHFGLHSNIQSFTGPQIKQAKNNFDYIIVVIPRKKFKKENLSLLFENSFVN